MAQSGSQTLGLALCMCLHMSIPTQSRIDGTMGLLRGIMLEGSNGIAPQRASIRSEVDSPSFCHACSLERQEFIPFEFPAGYRLRIFSVRIARFGRRSRHPGKERGANTPRGTSGRTIP
jgi:hypothetical protein